MLWAIQRARCRSRIMRGTGDISGNVEWPPNPFAVACCATLRGSYASQLGDGTHWMVEPGICLVHSHIRNAMHMFIHVGCIIFHAGSAVESWVETGLDAIFPT